MQNVKLTLEKFYNEDQIIAVQNAIEYGNLVSIFDPHYGDRTMCEVFQGALNGSEKFFAADRNNIVYVLKDEDGRLSIDNDREVGRIGAEGFTSWEADRGDLVIQGLTSNGRFKTAV